MSELINIGATANDKTGDDIRQAAITTNKFISETIIRVKSSSDFGVIDSTKVYVIDGVVDMGTTTIEVPAGGISITGYTFDASKLVSTENNYTMFTSPVGGSGNLLMTDVGIETSGDSSQVFNLTDANGFNAVEMSAVNFNNCTSRGELKNYRQGFESGTGYFGGKPELTLTGTWLGGYFIESSIARMLTDGAYFLFKAGVGLTFGSRFRSNQNLDLNASIGFFDFTPANFLNSNTLQLTECIITRNGASDPSDSTISPNIDHTDIASVWRNNSGIENTFIGGCIAISAEVTTTISSVGVFVDLAGTWSSMNLQHFDHSVNGQLKHIGSGSRNYNVFLDVPIDGGANNELDLKIVVWDSSASAFVDYKMNRRVVNNFQGGRDVAFFGYMASIVLDKDDYVKLQVANQSATTNVTGELGGEMRVEER